MILFVPLQSHFSTPVTARANDASTEMPATASAERAESGSAPRYRGREFGIGYGSSSGYSTGRHYLDRSTRALFRCR